MTPGIRKYKSASLTVAVPVGLPEDMQYGISELVSVQSGNPRNGHASGLMRSVCTEADVEGQVLLLQVKAFGDGPSDEQLKKWYAKHGFEVVQTEPCVLMAREPQ